MRSSSRTRVIILAVAMQFVSVLSIQAQLPPSRLFKPEGHGGGGHYYFPDDEIRRVTALDDVVTPHVDWGVPLAGGPIRVLALAQKEQGRWPIELKQRFDMELTTVYGYNRECLGTKVGRAVGLFVQDEVDVVARILQAMNEPLDVIVSDIEVKALGDDVRQRLSALIRSGVGYVGPTEGLVMDGFVADHPGQIAMVKATVPLAGLRAVAKAFDSPEAVAGSAVKLWVNNQGFRIANLDGYPRDDQKPDANRLQYLDQIDMEWEAWSALTGRVLLWAADRVSASSNVKVAWPESALARDNLPHRL